MYSRLLVEVTPPQPLYRSLMELRPSHGQSGSWAAHEGMCAQITSGLPTIRELTQHLSNATASQRICVGNFLTSPNAMVGMHRSLS